MNSNLFFFHSIIGGFHGSYVIPNFGPLSYCGLEGLAAVLKGVIRNNDMGHPIFSNLRDGVWLVDYCVDRLNRFFFQIHISFIFNSLNQIISHNV